MRWYKICAVLLLATAAIAERTGDKEKRGADTYVTATPKYATATASPQYVTVSTGAPVYATKIQSQPQYVQANKYNFVSAQPYEQHQQAVVQQQPKYILQQQYSHQPNAGGQISYVAPQQQHASYSYEAQQPGVKYAFAQPEQVKYAYVQPTAAKYVSAAPAQTQQFAKVAYSAQPNVYAAQPAHQQPHYSPAGSVSSFSFNSPHVSYSNLGLLSQAVGKAYTGQHQQPAAAQVQYVAAPAHYNPTQQVAYSGHPQVQYAAPQVQYVSAPQYAASPQLQLASHQGSHSSPQYVYSAPQLNYAAAAPKGHYATPGITYA